MGDIALLNEDSIIPTKWPLAKVVQVHPGKDKFVRVATVKTVNGTYKRPVAKMALLLRHPELDWKVKKFDNMAS